ncbi:hypothetical protein [Sphingobacterium sp.]|uniref:hypothetical protein n=1 Tax=Sphingobacterium sp. TaxID=341027 RepID=UPI0028AAC95E|nr:hypothetical protein [Sphingobacterium sp.]
MKRRKSVAKGSQICINYYLPNWRSIIIGIILIIVGGSTFFIGYDPNDSFKQNFSAMILDFKDVFRFLISLFMLLLHLAFIIGGFLLLRSSKKIIRARTDKKGLYFKRIEKKSGSMWALADLDPLVFVPYIQIVNIRIIESNWYGPRLELETFQGKEILTMLNVLSRKEKEQICQTVKEFGI